MKLIVCGKGGCGKSTVTALLARQYASMGRQVVVVDTDVSNTGLHRILGVEPVADFSDHFGGKPAMMEKVRAAHEAGMATNVAVLGRWSYTTIPAGYGSINDSVQLVSVGKLREVGEACTCSISAMARQFLMGLTTGENERVIVDTDAGIEHFGRGLDQLCDVILMVVDPSFESICLINKVADMADAIDVPLFFVLNKTDEVTSPALHAAISGKGLAIGEFQQDLDVMEAGLMGRVLPLGHPSAAAALNELSVRFGRN